MGPTDFGLAIADSGLQMSDAYPLLTSGPEGIRTPDLCSAIAALSQLSYRPSSAADCTRLSRACQEMQDAECRMQNESQFYILHSQFDFNSSLTVWYSDSARRSFSE